MKHVKSFFMMILCCAFFSWIYPDLFLADRMEVVTESAKSEIHVKSYLYQYLKRWFE